MKQLMESFKKYLNEGYYEIDPKAPMPIEEIIDRWIRGNKAIDYKVELGYHGMYSTKDLNDYREYPDERLRNPQNSEAYEELRDKIEKDGVIEPIIVMVSKSDGKAKIGEGNHRHAIAKELGIEYLPVRFLFWERSL
jgi:hypothetical protein